LRNRNEEEGGGPGLMARVHLPVPGVPLMPI
jgi:hypothetical protein